MHATFSGAGKGEKGVCAGRGRERDGALRRESMKCVLGGEENVRCEGKGKHMVCA